MQARIRSAIFWYGAGLLFTAVAFLFVFFSPLRNGSPFLVFLAVVMITARVAGLGPALFTLFLSTLTSVFFFVPPELSFGLPTLVDGVRLAVFILLGVVLTSMVVSNERSRLKAHLQARQQAALARLGQHALTSRELTALFDEATALVTETLKIEYCEMLEFLPDGTALLLRAGRGWKPGLVGHATVDTGLDSQAGFTLVSKEPVIVADLRREIRFHGPRLLTEHDVVSGMSVIIEGPNGPFGVLGAHTTQRRDFGPDEINFLQSVANVLAAAIANAQTEERLRLSNEQNAIIVKGVADGITMQAPNGQLLYVNETAAQMMGFSSAAEALNAPLGQIMDRYELLDENGELMPLNQLPGRLALQGRTVIGQSVRFRRRDGSADHWTLMSAAPVFDDHGHVRYGINILHDITDRKFAEQADREQRELLRVTLSSIGDAVIATDTRADITFMNPVAEQLTGWNSAQAVARPLDEIFRASNEETGSPLENPIVAVLREQNIVRVAAPIVMVTRDGRPIPIDLSAAPIRDAREHLIGMVLVFRDITARRRTDREMFRLAAVVNNTDDAIISTTLDGIVQTWNPGAEKLYGYPANEIIGKSITITYPPEHVNEFHEIMDQLQRGEFMANFDSVRVRKNGQRVDVSINPSAIRDRSGRIVGVSKIARDITERKRAEEATRFLADASDLLTSSLDYETTLTRVAQLAVPRIADWCAVDVRMDDGSIRQLALAHVDPSKVQLANELQKRFPPNPERSPLFTAIRMGKPILVPELTNEQLASSATNREHLRVLMELAPRSYMIVPLSARERILGAITLIAAESGRRFGPRDLALAQDLARRAALSVDNARLYHEARILNEELEDRVIKRTIELQTANRRLEK